MKKLLAIAVLVSATAFGATQVNTMGEMNHKMGMGSNNCSTTKSGHRGRMFNYLSESEQNTVKKNREDVRTMMSSEKPDWNKIEKLNQDNAKMMASARTKMMQDKQSNPNFKHNY
ncbi:MAG: hypothetical protein ACRC54_08380 [Fusobacteriaceae bacterium]